MCYAIAPSPGRLVWAALPCVCQNIVPVNKRTGRVSVSAQQYKEVPGPTWTGKVG